MGKVKWFIQELGYGYFTSDDGIDIFVSVKNPFEQSFIQGDRVKFDLIECQYGGLTAINTEKIKI
jgi:cold shock CspA family protein